MVKASLSWQGEVSFMCVQARDSRRYVLGSLGAAALVLLLCCLFSPAALAGVANAGLAGASRVNPLAGMPWGNYSGQLDEVFPAYRSASGEQQRLLGRIALRPRVRWFGSWYSDSEAEATAREYIDNVTGGRPGVLSQMAVFRVDPWEGDACRQLPSAAQQASYKRWIDAFAAGIGSARVALILQPDLPFALCVPNHSQLPLQLVSYAAQVFGALPHTTVYIDAGAADWPTVGQAAAMLRAAGVRYTRGFALGATHYDSNEHEILFGQKVVRALAAAHIGGRHFVINTAQNGRPFTFQQYHGPSYDNAAVCASRAARRCVTLGVPPTTDVTNGRWGLSGRARAAAGRLVDAYLWIGRPWLYNQADPFDLQRSLALAGTTPF
jgi:endoglucanase